MQLVTYVGDLPKKHRASVTYILNDIREKFFLEYSLWRRRYAESKKSLMFSSYIAHKTSLKNFFGKKNFKSNKYYLSYIDNGYGLTFLFNSKKHKHKPVGCVIFNKSDRYYRLRR